MNVEQFKAVMDNAALVEPPEVTAEETIARLATLSSLEYERVRDSEAAQLKIRVSQLDKEISNVKRSTRAQENGQIFPHVEVWPEPVEANELLSEILSTIKRFIVCDNETAIATTLWCAFTWVIDLVQVAPLAVISAPEKRCGKSQLLNLIGKLARNPLVASNISPSATFRVIEGYNPTLLIDEADTFFKDNEELRGVINSGHTRQSAYVIRNVGDNHEPKQFSTWGAKAISGIGSLPDTITDRAIILNLRRKLPNESVERLRHAEQTLFETLSSKLARFAQDSGSYIEAARPTLPETLNDRAQDNWEPLLAIADYAGCEWSKLARSTAIKLSKGGDEILSLSGQLLSDIQEILEKGDFDRISTASLIESLCADDERPWATYNRGKQIAPRQMANKLKEYGIYSKTIRIEGRPVKGYETSQFNEVFARYLPTPILSVYPLQSASSLEHSVTDAKSTDTPTKLSVTPKPLPSNTCNVVTDRNGYQALEDNYESEERAAIEAEAVMYKQMKGI